jgi:putative addiction module component (TIGR02574 family)
VIARSVAEIEADIQALEPADKERLLEFLLGDVGPADPEIDRAWLEEVQRRSRELDEGKVTAVSWDQVAVDVRARLRKLRT